MAGDATEPVVAEGLPDSGTAADRQKRDWGRYWRRRFAALVIGIIALLGVGALVIDSPIGHRFLADSLASYAPASGLRIKVGRIEGSVLSRATLHDVVLSDPKGEFLQIPEVELDWRPLKWFTSGLDVRKLIARRGVLSRLPELNPGDPDAPLLPDFAIRVDRFELNRLFVAEDVAGIGRYVDLRASVDIAQGRAKLNLLSDLGGEDDLFLHLDASEADNLLDLDFHYKAPVGGFLAGLVGAQDEVEAFVRGDGRWTDWRGGLYVREGGERFAAMRLSKTGDVYGVLGQVYPGDILSGIPARAVGDALSIKLATTFDSSVFDGQALLVGAGAWISADGTLDLAENRFETMAVHGRIADPGLLGMRVEGARMAFGLHGPFQDLSIAYRIAARRISAGSSELAGLAAKGTASRDGTRLTLPLEITADRIVTGVSWLDPELAGAALTGTITHENGRLAAQDLLLDAPGLTARMALAGSTTTGRYAFAGPVAMRGLPLEGLGTANAVADVRATIGGAQGWSVSAKVDGKLTNVANATLANLAGPAISLAADVTASGNAPIRVKSARVSSRNLRMTIAGSRALDGTVKLSGKGEQASYGPFTIDGTIDGEGPHAVLVFADPLPAAGLRDVRIAVDPAGDGFEVAAQGGSMLGPFDGEAFLAIPEGGPTRLEIARLAVSDTVLSGSIAFGDGGASGDLALSGGGVSGNVALKPTRAGQGIAADVILRNARFAGPVPITIRSAHLTANGTLGEQATIEAAVNAQGISRGKLFVGRLAGEGELRNGTGRFNVRLAGRRDARFNLRVVGDVSSERLAIGARGRYAGEPIRMPRRAVLLKRDDGWELQRSQIDFAGGSVQAEGRLGDATHLTVRLAGLPLEIADLFIADLSLGGTVSGTIDYDDTADTLATGRARLKFDDLTRSGLVLTSRPVDIAVAADLGPSELQARAVFRDNGNRNGRLQARIADLPTRGSLVERLRAGRLYAQMRYDGPADALWRLAAIETFDLTGPVALAGDVRGTLDAPVVRGTLRAADLRLQSSLTGTDISGIGARGSFDGSVLRLARFSGKAANGGSVTGSGSIDLSDIATSGVGMDIRVAAREARLLDRSDMGATVTGPLRIVSRNNVGTIAGRLEVVSGRWRLNNASAEATLPNIARREVNTPPDRQERTVSARPWRYLIDIDANNRFAVTGMGLDSEWSADIRLRGTTDAPRLLGEANLVRGGYEFAGKRFELTRGRIRFSGESPPSPRLDIVAEADVEDIDARIAITGTALAPQITFSSVPALPEEEVLSRLLFGDSIANISAPEALQLGAALASMQGGGGGGLDPINKLRGAIGLDRLRVVGADEALGRGTSVAVGEYLGRDLYVELVTDGQGYSATELEYRVTGWLSLLATVSSIGGNALEVEVSKDY